MMSFEKRKASSSNVSTVQYGQHRRQMLFAMAVVVLPVCPVCRRTGEW
ncbi:MAG: hypothetical protein U9Q78_07585 [Chloroflexota bacterium]|nr:hypothetical protein [Chloroflexota bacterium]